MFFTKSKAGSLQITKLNDLYSQMTNDVKSTFQPAKPLSLFQANLPKIKADKKNKKDQKNVFVIDFKGDKTASQTESLKKEISAIIAVSKKGDEVILRLNSPGGTVTGYGLAASELIRLKEKKINLTVCIDEVAASGGYMMACVADKVIASNFAMIGSIGVALEMPNFYQLLEKLGVKYLQVTSGEHKRTVSFGTQIKDENIAKLTDDLEQVHSLFKSHVQHYRQNVDISAVSKGDVWSAIKAKELNLVDDLQTSENMIFNACQNKNVYLLKWAIPSTPLNILSLAAQASTKGIVNALLENPALQNTRIY